MASRCLITLIGRLETRLVTKSVRLRLCKQIVKELSSSSLAWKEISISLGHFEFYQTHSSTGTRRVEHSFEIANHIVKRDNTL